jgi:hypothetical protein
MVRLICTVCIVEPHYDFDARTHTVRFGPFVTCPIKKEASSFTDTRHRAVPITDTLRKRQAFVAACAPV